VDGYLEIFAIGLMLGFFAGLVFGSGGGSSYRDHDHHHHHW